MQNKIYNNKTFYDKDHHPQKNIRLLFLLYIILDIELQ